MQHFATNKTYGIYKVLNIIENFKFEVECLDCKKISVMDDHLFKNYQHCHCKDRIESNIIGKIIKNYKIIDIKKNIATCQCLSCGKIKQESLHVTLDGNITGCVCKSNAINIDEMVGKTFGSWTVLSRVENTKFVIVQCICKKIQKLKEHVLRRGLSKSCGCMINIHKLKFSKVIYPGVKIGKLTIIESVVEYNETGRPRKLWKAKCDCGKIILKSDSALRNKKLKNPISCGCSRKKT